VDQNVMIGGKMRKKYIEINKYMVVASIEKTFAEIHRDELDLLKATGWTSFPEIAGVVGLSDPEKNILAALCAQEEADPQRLSSDLGSPDEQANALSSGLEKVARLRNLLDGYASIFKTIR
jgi:hypothetical protein